MCLSLLTPVVQKQSVMQDIVQYVKYIEAVYKVYGE